MQGDFPPPGDINFWTVLLGVVMAVWGGATSYAYRVLRGAKCNLREFFLEIFISSFAGLLAFLLAIYLGVPVYFAGAISGLAGHAGTRTIILMQRALFAKARRLAK